LGHVRADDYSRWVSQNEGGSILNQKAVLWICDKQGAKKNSKFFCLLPYFLKTTFTVDQSLKTKIQKEVEKIVEIKVFLPYFFSFLMVGYESV
jgi:hypothetical protein